MQYIMDRNDVRGGIEERRTITGTAQLYRGCKYKQKRPIFAATSNKHVMFVHG